MVQGVRNQNAETEFERLREPVRWFAQRMEDVLRKNDYKGGWENCTAGYLLKKLAEEVGELEEAIGRGIKTEQNREHAITEAADVANIAMMIADLLRKGLV